MMYDVNIFGCDNLINIKRNFTTTPNIHSTSIVGLTDCSSVGHIC